MFGIAIFLIAIFLLITNKRIDWVVTIIMFLAFGYLGQNRGILADFDQYFNASLILIVLLWIHVKKHYKNTEGNNIGQASLYSGFIALFCYVIFTVIIDIFINQIDLWSVLRTSRHWVLLLSFIPIRLIPSNIIYKSQIQLLWLTVLLDIIILIEGFLGVAYVSIGSQVTMEEISVERGAIPSTFTVFYIFALYNDFGNFGKIKKYGLMSILILTIMKSAIRSYFIAVFLGLSIISLLKSNNIGRSIRNLLIVGICGFAIYNSSGAMKTRMQNADELKASNIEDSDGTFAIRWLSITERYDYISLSPRTLLFGVGNVPSTDFKGHKFITYTDSAFDTGDTCWVGLECRLGIIGTALLVWIMILFIKIMYQHRDRSTYAITLFAYLFCSLTVLSMAGNYMSYGQFWLLPFMYLSFISKNKFNDCNTH